jgi:hypothetical protein
LQHKDEVRWLSWAIALSVFAFLALPVVARATTSASGDTPATSLHDSAAGHSSPLALEWSGAADHTDEVPEPEESDGEALVSAAPAGVVWLVITSESAVAPRPVAIRTWFTRASPRSPPLA